MMGLDEVWSVMERRQNANRCSSLLSWIQNLRYRSILGVVVSGINLLEIGSHKIKFWVLGGLASIAGPCSDRLTPAELAARRHAQRANRTITSEPSS